MISHLNDHGATDKIAAIDVSPEICDRFFSVIADAGFKVLGSLRSPLNVAGVVRLVIKGSALPDECAKAMHLVIFTMEVEGYGAQRITRIREISLLDALSRQDLVA